MKLVAQPKPLEAYPWRLKKDDPRLTVVYQRDKEMRDAEALFWVWGCMLWRLHRLEKINNEEKEAGDQYYEVVQDYNRTQATDPDELPAAARDLALRRIEKAKRLYRGATMALAGFRKQVDDVVLREEWPVGEAGHKRVRTGLRRLKFFFDGRTKSERNVV